MLRSVIKHARFINDVWQMLRMAWRESVMFATLDKKEFIQRIAVMAPGRPFLVAAKQIAVRMKRQPHGESNPGAHGLTAGEIRGDTLNGPAIHRCAIAAQSRRLIDEKWLGEAR